MGDFNETISVIEHSGHSVLTAGMLDFQDVLSTCSLSDLSYQGPLFTWWNHRTDGPISKKLDRRALISDSWLDTFPMSHAIFEPGGVSDHARCLVHLGADSSSVRRPFKFFTMLTTLHNFLPTVDDYWKNTTPLFVSRQAFYRLSRKLKLMKPVLRSLNNSSIGHIPTKVKEAYEILCVKQMAALNSPSELSFLEEKIASDRWSFLISLEESFYMQKSRICWLQLGDQNTRFFHKSTQARNSRNAIRAIRDDEGVLKTDQDDIKATAADWYSKFLNSVPDDYEGIDDNVLEELFDYRLSTADKELLVREITSEEIKSVLWGMPSSKAPEPDGFRKEFFVKAWPIVGADVVVAIRSFFLNGFMPKGVNSTILALIPKREDSMEFKDFRPISCCNTLYKIVSKILANRIKRVLPEFIMPNQSAFTHDRLLLENVLLATELVKDYHKSDISGRCVMKIDIAKAFDTV